MVVNVFALARRTDVMDVLVCRRVGWRERRAKVRGDGSERDCSVADLRGNIIPLGENARRVDECSGFFAVALVAVGTVDVPVRAFAAGGTAWTVAPALPRTVEGTALEIGFGVALILRRALTWVSVGLVAGAVVQ